MDQITKERDLAQAKCAEMRAVLEWLWDDDEMGYMVDDGGDECTKCGGGRNYHTDSCPQGKIEHALSSDCGKGWKSPQQVREMLEPTTAFLKLALEPVFPGTWLDEEGHLELARLEALIKEAK